jgi:hypothetical protein
MDIIWGVDWIHLAEDTDHWWALVNAVTNLMAGNFVTSWANISFSWRAVLLGVSYGIHLQFFSYESSFFEVLNAFPRINFLVFNIQIPSHEKPDVSHNEINSSLFIKRINHITSWKTMFMLFN